MVDSGTNRNHLKAALLQNAFAGITAKLNYKGKDRSQRQLEAAFTRYTVIFTGETLPNGKKADAVYIELHPRYREVLNNAPVRPLNYQDLKVLPPGAQRLYELLSFKVYSALRHGQPEAKLTYSEYCTFAAQGRYYRLWKVKRQMRRLERHHLASGYLKSVRYQRCTDRGGLPDWDIFYTPGPKARAEYQAFTIKAQMRPSAEGPQPTVQPRESPLLSSPPPARASKPASERAPDGAPEASLDPQLLAELRSRGISEKQARKLLAELRDGQEALDQLEWGDYLIQQNPRGFRNPPGLYISLMRDNVQPPDSFESSRKRKLRQEALKAQQDQEYRHWQLELAYRNYRDQAIDRYLQDHASADEINSIVQGSVRARRQQCPHLPAGIITTQTIAEIAHQDMRFQIGQRLSLLTFDEFCRQQQTEQPSQSPPPDRPANNAVTN